MPNWFEKHKGKAEDQPSPSHDGPSETKKPGVVRRLSFKKKFKDIVFDMEHGQNKPEMASQSSLNATLHFKKTQKMPLEQKTTSSDPVKLKKIHVKETKRVSDPDIKPKLQPMKYRRPITASQPPGSNQQTASEVTQDENLSDIHIINVSVPHTTKTLPNKQTDRISDDNTGPNTGHKSIETDSGSGSTQKVAPSKSKVQILAQTFDPERYHERNPAEAQGIVTQKSFSPQNKYGNKKLSLNVCDITDDDKDSTMKINQQLDTMPYRCVDSTDDADEEDIRIEEEEASLTVPKQGIDKGPVGGLVCGNERAIQTELRSDDGGNQKKRVEVCADEDISTKVPSSPDAHVEHIIASKMEIFLNYPDVITFTGVLGKDNPGLFDKPSTSKQAPVELNAKDLKKLNQNNGYDHEKAVVALHGTLEKPNKDDTEEDDVKLNDKKLEKLEKLISAKENSIKTFITKNDVLTTELLNTAELLAEKEHSLRLVNESLQVVVDRCNYKTKQFQSMEETNGNLVDQNMTLQNEVDVSKKKLSDLESEVQDYMRLNDENNDVISDQKQLLRRREAEMLELRRECEDKVDREKGSAESIKKRAERSSAEVEEVQEHLKRLREKMEKEKHEMFEEIQISEKDMTDMLVKLNASESQLKKSKDEQMETANKLTFAESELHAVQLKLNGVTKSSSQMGDELSDLQQKTNITTADNKSLKKEIETLQATNETLTQQKSTMSSKLSDLHQQLKAEKDSSTKSNQNVDDYKRQCQQYQSELTMASTRSEEMVKATIEEEAEARRKWQMRLQEAEDEIIRLTAKLKASEKARAEQSSELEQVSFDYNHVTKSYTTLEKRYNHSEQVLHEQSLVEQENKEKIEAMIRRMNDYTAQIGALKQEKEDEASSNRELRSKLKTIQDQKEELEHQQDNDDRCKLEMTRHVAKLKEQLETSTSTISELETDMEQANTRTNKAHKDLLLALEKHTTTMTEKEEEIDLVKKTCRGTIYLLKNQVDEADQEITKLTATKRDLEQEILLLQDDLDEAEATVNELNNEIPRQQDILEQLNMSLGEVNVRCEALQDALVRADTKCTQVQARNEELEDDVKKEETAKRLLEQDNIDLNNKVSEQTAKTEGLLDTLDKIEQQLQSQISGMEILEDEKGEWTLEKRRTRELITILEADNKHLEEVKANLEVTESKLKTRFQDMTSEHDDMLKSLKTSQRTRVRTLEGRVAELEAQLEDETTRRTDNEKGAKKLERILKDVEIQAMEDTKSIERQVDQISNLSLRNKNLKVQCADSESRVISLQSRLRKMTTEMEESENRATTMSKIMSTPSASRCNTPTSLRQSALLRSSGVGGSRPPSRLISPEVEQILMSGRNSPIGPLSPGYIPLPLGRIGAKSPLPMTNGRSAFHFDHDTSHKLDLIKDIERDVEIVEEHEAEFVNMVSAAVLLSPGEVAEQPKLVVTSEDGPTDGHAI